MNNVGHSLVEWLESKGEICLELNEEAATIPTHRVPGESDYNDELLNEEERSQIDLSKIGKGENLGIILNENQRSGIESNIGQGRDSTKKSQQHILAWYQPIHYYGYDWGIFITSEGLLEFASNIACYIKKLEPLIAEKLVYAAFCVLYSHEKFHHRMESFAIRLHVVESKACYRKYSKSVYKNAISTGTSAKEEKLAMASMFREILDVSKSRVLGKEVTRATREYLIDLFASVNSSYSGAGFVVKDKQYAQELWQLQSEIQEATTTPTRSVFEWEYAPQITSPLFRISQNIWEITPPNQSHVLPRGNPIAVPRRKVEKILKESGYIEIRSAGNGGHVKWRGPNGEMMILPAGSEIFGSTVSSIAKSLRITVRELRNS